jgi:hypothetical protein
MFHSILLATSTRIQYKIYFFVGQKLAITKQKENSIICIFKKKTFANWWHLNTKGIFYKISKEKPWPKLEWWRGFKFHYIRVWGGNLKRFRKRLHVQQIFLITYYVCIIVIGRLCHIMWSRKQHNHHPDLKTKLT